MKPHEASPARSSDMCRGASGVFPPSVQTASASSGHVQAVPGLSRQRGMASACCGVHSHTRQPARALLCRLDKLTHVPPAASAMVCAPPPLMGLCGASLDQHMASASVTED